MHKLTAPNIRDLSFRLKTADSVLPYLHLCHWRRAVAGRRRRPEDQVEKQRVLRVTQTGGAVRTPPPQPHKIRCIPRKWRVSKFYVRGYIGNSRMHNLLPYIASHVQIERVRYCLRMRTALSIQWIQRVKPPDSRTSPRGSVRHSRLGKQRRARCIPPASGEEARTPSRAWPPFRGFYGR